MSRYVKTQGRLIEALCKGTYATVASNTTLCIDFHEDPNLVYLSFGPENWPRQAASAEDLRELAALFTSLAYWLEG